MKPLSDIQQITEEILRFRDERDWKKYHDGKNLAAELLEVFLWKGNEEINEDRLREELADVFYSALLIAEKYKLDVKDIVLKKLENNRQKYPVEKAKGSNKKYNDL